MVSGEHPMWFPLPEDPCARPYEVVMEQALVKRTKPPSSIDGLESLPAQEHALEAIAFGLLAHAQTVLQCCPAR